MALPNIFSPEVSQKIIDRINTLSPETLAKWGKMDVAQMLAHTNVSYEMIYENKHPKPNFFMRFIMKTLVKNTVVNEKPYKHNSPTAPAFKMVNRKNFEAEKQRLINYIRQTQQKGEAFFESRESHSFGKLSLNEWNNMLFKHLDHHLSQFGA